MFQKLVQPVPVCAQQAGMGAASMVRRDKSPRGRAERAEASTARGWPSGKRSATASLRGAVTVTSASGRGLDGQYEFATGG